VQRFASLLCTLLSAQASLAASYAITGGTLETVSDAGTIPDGTLVIRDGRITALGTDVAIPDDAEVIDAAGKVVTPGLMPGYSSLGLAEIDLIDETVDDRQRSDRFAAAVDVTDAFNPASSLIPIARIEGITRAVIAPTLALGSHDGGGGRISLIAGRAAVIDLSGTPGSVIRRRVGMFVELGEAGAAASGGSRSVAMLELREALTDARDYAKRRNEAWLERDRAPSRLDLEALGAVLTRKIPLVAHVHRASDIRALLRLASEFGLDVVVLGGAEAWMLADELSAANVPVILDPLQNLPASFERLGARLESAALLDAAGVTLAFSAPDPHNDRNIRQLAGNAVAYGLPRDSALAALTLGPVRIFGLEADRGTLATGSVADVVVWDGDPLEVTSFADAVFIAGEKIPMESRQTKLRDRYLDLDRPLPPAYTKP
jgi:imidazolonepropionase-like amidohydrolase